MVDCLRDVAKPTVVLWDGWGPLAREDEQAFKVALDVVHRARGRGAGVRRAAARRGPLDLDPVAGLTWPQRVWEGSADRTRPRALDTLGYELLALDLDAGTAEASFTVGEEFGNTVGNVQGGFLAAMLDATLGTAIVATLEAGRGRADRGAEDQLPAAGADRPDRRPRPDPQARAPGSRSSRASCTTRTGPVLATATGTFLVTRAPDASG